MVWLVLLVELWSRMFRSVVALLSKQIPRRRNFCSMKKLQSTDVIDKSLLLQELSSEFGDVCLKVNKIVDDEINSIPIAEWRNRISLMKMFNFKDDECFEIISKFPIFLKIPTTLLENNLSRWRNCEMGLDDVHNLIIGCPQLLSVETQEILLRVPYLICTFKKKLLFTILLNCPNVMFDEWQYTINKIDYLLKEKVVEKREILHSRALSMPLNLMMLRFDLLEKCGIYKTPTINYHKRNKFDTSKHKNPHLKKITHESNYIFATTVARITFEEYEVYENLFEMEDYQRNKNTKENDDNDD